MSIITESSKIISCAEAIDNYVQDFKRALIADALVIPLDSAISSDKMAHRIEASSLLFKHPTRILRALHDLKDLNEYIQAAKPVLWAPGEFVVNSYPIAFDLDHVFLINYRKKKNTIQSISGFHADFMGEIESLGRENRHRLTIRRICEAMNGCSEAYIILDRKRAFKTLFSANWDWFYCLEIVLAGLQRIVRSRSSAYKELILNILTSENVVVELRINKKSGIVRSFYPNIVLSESYLRYGSDNTVEWEGEA